MNAVLFTDRLDAGVQLAQRLLDYKADEPIILALPRGGVVIGFAVSKELLAPLDVLVVRKIGLPQNPELAVGAIAEGGIIVLDPNTMNILGISQNDIQETIVNETAELERRVIAYRGNRRQPQVKDKTVILVDDGLATGTTAQAAVTSLRLQEPKKIILAVPVCSKESARTLAPQIDVLINLHEPQFFSSVGEWYEEFEQLSDRDVIHFLEQARKELSGNQ